MALELVREIVVFMADSSAECTSTVGQVEELRDPALLQPDLAKVRPVRLLLYCICEKGKQAETVAIHAFFVAAAASSNSRGQRKKLCLV